jgi:hypothetical protein
MGKSASSECTGEPALASGSASLMEADHEFGEGSIFETDWTVNPFKVIIEPVLLRQESPCRRRLVAWRMVGAKLDHPL